MIENPELPLLYLQKNIIARPRMAEHARLLHITLQLNRRCAAGLEYLTTGGSIFQQLL